MDPRPDQLASAPFPTIPAPAPRPRALKSRRHAAAAAPSAPLRPPAVSSHHAASGVRRPGREFSSFVFGAASSPPNPVSAEPAGPRSDAFVLGGNAAYLTPLGSELGGVGGLKAGGFASLDMDSRNSGAGGEMSVGRGGSHAATFVFGSSESGVSDSNRELFGSNKGLPSNLSEAASNLSIQDSFKIGDADVSKGSDQMSEMNVCDTFGSKEGGSNSSDITDHPELFFSSNTKTRSFSSQASCSSLQPDESVSLKPANDGNGSAGEGCGDKDNVMNDESIFSTEGGRIRQNFFMFGEGSNLSTDPRGFAANAAQSNIKKVDALKEKDNLTCSSEQLDASAAQNNTSAKFTLQAANQQHDPSNSNSDISHIEPHKHARSSAPNAATFNFGSQHDSAKDSFRKLHDGMGTEDAEVTALELNESELFEKLFTVQNHNTASRDKEVGKGSGTNRKTGKLKKFSSAHQSPSVLPVFRNEHFSGKMVPESLGGSLVMDRSDNSAHMKFPGEALATCRKPVDIFSCDIPSGTAKPASETCDASRTENDEGRFSTMPTGFGKKTNLHLEEIYSFELEDSGIGQSNYGAEEDDTNRSVPQTTESSDDGITLSSVEISGQSDFVFGAATFGQNQLTAQRRYSRKKSGGRGNHTNPIQSVLPSAIVLAHSDVSASQRCSASVSQWTEHSKAEQKTGTASGEPTSTKTTSLGHQEDCETWRMRGNQAYAEGWLAKAEECYTCGINSFSPNEVSQKSLMLCYSNRAAARMSLGRMREALSDCRRATEIDSSFLKAQVRAATCLLALGEVEEALKSYKMCLNHEPGLDSKVLEEASDGLRKAQKVSNFMHQSKEYLATKASNKISKALEMISDALLISNYSESLMMMKAEVLLRLQRYEEVIQFCEETLLLAERNSVPLSSDEHSKNYLGNDNCSVKLWRYYLTAKSYFFLGNLEGAHQFLKKYEQATLVGDRYGKQSQQSVLSFFVTVCELLRLKAAGNEAFQAGKYSEAVEQYTAALTCNTESLPFTAVCLGNRAAAYQAMGQILDAIADCSLAIALDASYSKAISRRATLYELIRDYGQATNDLHRLISLLEKQLQENKSMPSEKSVSIRSNLNRANFRLSALEGEARKGTSLNMYLILGIEPSCSAVDVKKAYRKAALRHHPDKAGNFLVRSENVDDALWREIADEIHRDADYLFKLIGRAYAVLSDPTMRLKYDTEEQLREDRKRGNTNSASECQS